MDANYILLWILGVYWLSTILGTLRHGLPADRGSVAIAAACLGAFLLALLIVPSRAGILGAIPWLLFLVLPARLASWRNRLLAAQRHDAARRLTRVIGVLHPTSAAREAQAYAEAHELARRGRPEEARRRLEDLAGRDTPAGVAARLETLWIDGRWDELRRFVETHRRRGALLQDPAALVLYLRSLGETGDVERMAHAYRERLPVLRRGPDEGLRHAQLFVSALGGRTDATETLLGHQLAGLGEEAKAHWRATAAQAAGDPAAAATLLQPLQASNDRLAREAAARRLSRPIAPVAPSHGAREILDLVAREAAFDAGRGRPAAAAPPRRLPATGAVMGLLGIVFLFEIPGGSSDPENLYRLGAMVAPVAAVGGQWWRALTASLLHYGPLHLGMNLLALSLFGRHLERLVGPLRFLACFFVAGPASMLASALLWTGTAEHPVTVIVGASGGVLGCVGATAATLLWRYVATRHAPAARQLRDIGIVVAIQTAFDLSTPEVSFAAHASGLVIGFLMGSALELVRPPRVADAAAEPTSRP